MTTKPQSTTEPKMEPCRWCAEGDTPKFLDADGTLVSITGNEGILSHAYEEYWWPCLKFGVEMRSIGISPASAAPVVDNFETWLNNYWPDWRKAESAPVELMRAAWDAAIRLMKFNELALKGAIDYTVELETKLAAAKQQSNQLTDLQRAVIEHDDDMARLDRNTIAVTSPTAAAATPVEQSDKPLPTIKEMSGSIHYGGRMVINADNEPAIEDAATGSSTSARAAAEEQKISNRLQSES